MRKTILALVLFTAACQQGKSKLDDDKTAKPVTSQSGSAAPDTSIDINSKDILARPAGTEAVEVKHVLIAWKELDARTYKGKIDPRAKNRTNEEAAKLAQDIAAKLKADPSTIDAQVKASSEDPGSLSGDPYPVEKDSPFVPEFKALALRLKPNEVGIVKTAFGYHVMMRVPPPPPDPLESTEILTRAPEEGPVSVEHLLIGWKDAPQAKRMSDPRAKARSKEEADKLATELLSKARAPGADFAKLMKDFSEDPSSKDNAKPYEVSSDTPYPFKNLSLRLHEGEVGLEKSGFGWHLIKRLPPDSLESKDILARTETSPKVKVKHVLLGWTDAHAEDPRGVKRTRAELEKLVNDTVKKLNGGAKIEDVMKELSEDPGSAATGNSYDVAAESQFVPSFKKLSLRLKPNEVGVVKSPYGIHIIKRVE